MQALSFRCNILPQVGFMDASIFQAFPSEYCHPDVHISGHGNSSHFVCWIQPLFSPTSEPPFENKPNIDTVFKYRVCIMSKFVKFFCLFQPKYKYPTYQPVSQWTAIQICIFLTRMFVYDTSITIQWIKLVNTKFGIPKLHCLVIGWAESQCWATFA